MALFQKLKGLNLKSWLKLGRLTDCMRGDGDTCDHFLCFYPGNSGYFVQKLIKRLINKLNFDDHNIEKIKNLDKNNIVVYASKNKGVLDFLYFHTKLKTLDLPYPQIGFDFRFFFLLPVKRLCRIFVCHMNYFFTIFILKMHIQQGMPQNNY